MEIGQDTVRRDAPQRDQRPNRTTPLLFRDADAVRSTVWNLLAEIAQQRPLTRDEIRLRCVVRPQPWRSAGCDRSTWYRRRKRALLSTDVAEAA
jgi:hypothetical protein